MPLVVKQQTKFHLMRQRRHEIMVSVERGQDNRMLEGRQILISIQHRQTRPTGTVWTMSYTRVVHICRSWIFSTCVRDRVRNSHGVPNLSTKIRTRPMSPASHSPPVSLFSIIVSHSPFIAWSAFHTSHDRYSIYFIYSPSLT